jgi:hypothetical protein
MLAPLMDLVASPSAHVQEPFFARKTITAGGSYDLGAIDLAVVAPPIFP